MIRAGSSGRRAHPPRRAPRVATRGEIDALILSCIWSYSSVELIPRDCASAKRAANGNIVSLRYAPDAEHARKVSAHGSVPPPASTQIIGLNFSRPVTHKAQAPIASLPPPARQALDSRRCRTRSTLP